MFANVCTPSCLTYVNLRWDCQPGVQEQMPPAQWSRQHGEKAFALLVLLCCFAVVLVIVLASSDDTTPPDKEALLYTVKSGSGWPP